MKYVLGSVLLLFLLAVLGSMLNLITIPWLRFDSKVNMERGIVTKTYNADNAIYNYHWFQERAGAIKATEQQIVIADKAVVDFKLDMTKDSFEDKNELARLRSVAQGLRSQRASFINEYNAKAGEVDKAMFVDGLPLFFSL